MNAERRAAIERRIAHAVTSAPTVVPLHVGVAVMYALLEIADAIEAQTAEAHARGEKLGDAALDMMAEARKHLGITESVSPVPAINGQVCDCGRLAKL